MIGKQVGNYRVDVKIGEDALGLLYGAQHVAGGFPATVRHVVAEFAEVQPIARFAELSRAAGVLNHANIFNLRDIIWSGRNVFMAGEALPLHGNTLLDAIRRDGRILPELTVKLGWQLAAALAATHGANVVHCCLRAESVWVYADGHAMGGFRAKIMDFGVQAFLVPGRPTWSSKHMAALGAPLYMAPEQCRHGLADYRTDCYALGGILYHMITGRPPFTHQHPDELAQAHATLAPRPPSSIDSSTPRELDALIVALLAKDPAQRPTAPQAAYELDRIGKHFWPPRSHEVQTMQVDTRTGGPPPPSRIHVTQAAPQLDEPLDRPRRWPILLAVAGLGLAGAGLALAITQPWAHKSSVNAAPAVDARP